MKSLPELFGPIRLTSAARLVVRTADLQNNLLVSEQTVDSRRFTPLQPEAELNNLVNSRYWRMTSTLQVMHPARFFERTARRVRDLLMGNPNFLNLVKRLLKKSPWLWEKAKQTFLFGESENAGFTTFKCQDTLIHFSNAPLMDQRGIGRVSREIFREFSEKYEILPETDKTDRAAKHVHFYSSIHWCPAKLPYPTVVMVHDVIPLLFPDKFPKPVIRDWEHRLAPIARQAQHLVAISHANVQPTHECLGVLLEHISVVHNGVSSLTIDPECKIDLPSDPFLVYLGSHDRHKNIEVVLRALQDPKLSSVHLVLIGDNQSCAGTARQFGLVDRVHFLGKLDDGAVAFTLSQSLGLVFPSLFEGFGLPPLEATLLGVPVICSNRPAMNELINSGVFFCDPYDPDEWIEAIQRLATDGVDHNDIEALQRQIKEHYNWHKSAQDLAQVLITHAQPL